MSKNSSQLSMTDYQALILGIPKYCANATFSVASQTFTAAPAAAATVTQPAAATASATTSPVTPAAGNGAAPVVSVHA